MHCASCGRENRPDALFCAGCGDALTRSCVSCDRQLDADARFCDVCGTSIGGEVEAKSRDESVGSGEAVEGIAGEDESAMPFEELPARDGPVGESVNRASEMGQRLAGLLRAGDFDAYRACYHPDARIVSHLFTRHLTDSEDVGRDAYVANVVSRAESGLDFGEHEMRTLAVRGERLVLNEFSAPSGGVWETSMFAIRELGDDGRIVYTSYYEPEAFIDAHVELDRRFIEAEGAPSHRVLRVVARFNESVARGDLDAWDGVMSEEVVAVDHGSLSWGTLERPALVERIRSLFDTAVIRRSVVRRYLRLTAERPS